MSETTGWGERLRYQFDKSMAAGPAALIAYLALISLVLIATAGAVLAIFGIAPAGDDGLSFFEGFWLSLMRTLDPGTMGGDQGWAFRIVALLVTLGGIFVVAALIGVIATALDAKLEELRKGRSRVLETGHTVILNWSPSVFDIVSELMVANTSERRARIVFVADKDKVEMEDELKAKVKRARNTQFICRSGKPTDLYDLQLASPETAKSIIIVSPEAEGPDAQVIKTILALVNDPKRKEGRYRIAAEIQDAANAEVARVVGGDEVQLVLADEVISRIVVHSSRQSGLSAVYSELLDFDGCEIYTIDQPGLAGRTFGDATTAYEGSTLIGLAGADRRVRLNPPADTVIEPGQRAILIAEDDSAIRIVEGAPQIDAERIRAAPVSTPRPERLLLLGWNRRGSMIVRELARYVAPGSHLTLAADGPEMDEASAELDGAEGLTVERRRLDTTRRAALEQLDVPSYDSVMVLGDTEHLSAEDADTRTLVTLLHLRQIDEQSGKHVKVVSEMADIRNRELAEVTRADDFVVSNKLVSQMLAQASENAYIEAIFTDLLDEAGSEIYMRPIEDYVSPEGGPLSFYTLAEAARRRNEVALGYCRGGGRGGVVVNPKKSEALDFAAGDRLIVLAEG